MSRQGAIALSYPAWDGTVEVTPSVGLVTTITPRADDSVASLMARLVAALRVRTDAAWDWWINDAGKVVLESDDSFDWVATDDVATRCALTSASSSGGQVVGTARASGVYVPDDGVEATPEVSTTVAAPTGTGAEGAPPRPSAAGAASVAGVDSGELSDIETDAVGVYDVVDPRGRVLARYVVAGWIRTYPGRLQTGAARLRPDGSVAVLQEVPA